MKHAEVWVNRCERECCTPIFRDLSEAEFRELVGIMHPLEFARAERIFRPGTPGFECYVLCQGAVRLVQQPLGERRRQVVSLLRRPALFGETSLFMDQVHWVSAETLTPVQLAILPREPFLDYLQLHPVVMIRLLEKLAHEVKEMHARLLRMTYAGAEERLAEVLVRLGEEFGQPIKRGVEIELELMRAELGEFAGLTAETTIRLLGRWVEQGLIELTGRRIRLLDLERLRWLAGFS